MILLNHLDYMKNVNEYPLVLPKNEILLGDSLELLASLPDRSVDMVFADPPYNLQLSGELRRPNDSRVDGVEEDWDKFDGFMSYDRFTWKWLDECRRVLKDDGTLWVIGSYHNIYRVGATLQDLGYWILNDVVWVKTNPMPNFRGRRFTNAHETLIWCARSAASKYTFNYEAMKALNDDLQMRSDWVMPICTGHERLKNADGAKAHPTQKPEALLHRAILAATNPGDIVLDPFFGTGTTGAVAKKLGREYLGLEQDPNYVSIAHKRLREIAGAVDLSLVQTPSKRKEPRIPFGWLVERGLLEPGTVLRSHCRRWSAKVRADGTVIAADHRGSIHQVGAAVQGAASCNGWTFWYLPSDGKDLPIDVLRRKLRAELY